VDVSPDGKYIIGSGKLQSITTVFNFEIGSQWSLLMMGPGRRRCP
jgi:hypothetical protein